MRAIRDTYKLLPLKESADLNYLCKFILKTGSNITNRALGLIGRVPDCQLGEFQFKSGRALILKSVLKKKLCLPNIRMIKKISNTLQPTPSLGSSSPALEAAPGPYLRGGVG